MLSSIKVLIPCPVCVNYRTILLRRSKGCETLPNLRRVLKLHPNNIKRVL